MKIVVLGASGLIGHKLSQILGEAGHEVCGFIHGEKCSVPKLDLLPFYRIFENCDVLNLPELSEKLSDIKPDVVLNCVGITKRKDSINVPVQAIGVNSLFPHQLVELSSAIGFRVIHFSTDCVFNGKVGGYTEDSIPDGEDMYGKTKALGEVRYDNSLTLRSSFIGRELTGKTELLEWLIAQNGTTVKGFTEAYYSGVSTIFMAGVVRDIIENYPQLSDLHQLATTEPISKYDLLCTARDAFGLDIEIVPDDSFKIKPTLNGGKLASAIKLNVPAWPSMMAELAADHLYKNL